MLHAVRLSKEGFGMADQILRAPSRTVLAMLTYSNFLADYQETSTEINRENP